MILSYTDGVTKSIGCLQDGMSHRVGTHGMGRRADEGDGGEEKGYQPHLSCTIASARWISNSHFAAQSMVKGHINLRCRVWLR